MKTSFICFCILFCITERAFTQADSTAAQHPWKVHAEVSAFIFPDDFFLSPVVWVKKSHLHLEARYNYEDFQTASAFAGYNVEVGNELFLMATPMLGFCAGNTDAILPALEFELMYGKFGWYGEAEYAFDLHDSGDNFWSFWSELYYSPADWTWFGFSAQKLRTDEDGLDVQRGLFWAVQKNWFVVTGYYFNPFTSDQFALLNLGVTF